MSQEPPKIVWDGQVPPEPPATDAHGLRIGRPATEQDALDRPGELASPEAMPRATRRLELRCDNHTGQWPLLAVVGPEHVLTDLELLPYPGRDDAILEVNCMRCRTAWRVPMLAVRALVDARRERLKVVGMSSIGEASPWQG